MIKYALVGALAAMSMAASAEGMYVGGALGQAQVNIDCSGTSSCDDSDTGFKLLLGTQFSPEVGLEVAYVSFGKASVAGPYAGYSVNADIKSHGLLLNGAFRYAVSPDFSLVGRLGASILSTKLSGSVAGYGSVSEDKVAVNPYLGVGVEYALTKTLRLTADADFTQAEVELRGTSDSGGVQLLSIGLRYSF